MKSITLHGPAARNDGGYVDAGTTVDVGKQPDQIDAARAKDLVDGLRAVDSTKTAAGESTKVS